jgi:hypothetical protein
VELVLLIELGIQKQLCGHIHHSLHGMSAAPDESVFVTTTHGVVCVVSAAMATVGDLVD